MLASIQCSGLDDAIAIVSKKKNRMFSHLEMAQLIEAEMLIFTCSLALFQSL